MGLREDMLKEVLGEIDNWIEVHEKHGQDAFVGVAQMQAVSRANALAIRETESEIVAMPTVHAVKLIALANIGMHSVVTRLLALGKVTEERVGFGNDEERRKGGRGS